MFDFYKEKKKEEKEDTKKTTSVAKVTKKYPIFEIKERGSIVLSPEILTQIMYLHSHIGETEWSGMLLYTISEGSIARPEKLKIKAEHIFLMDIGTPGYTEYETDGDIVDLYTEVDGAMDMKTGHIHTHHKMSAYFSGTDMSELNDNVDKHNYYLSLIVNFSGNFAAKVAFISTVKQSSLLNYTDDSGKKKTFKRSRDEEVMAIINLDILFSYKNDFFYDRLPTLKKKLEDAKKAKAKKWDNSKFGKYDRYNYSQRDQLELPYGKNGFEEQADRPIDSDDIDPQKLTTGQVEKLTKNIISVTADMSESRNVYSLLNILSTKNDPSSDEFAFYYDFLSKNMDAIVSSFFAEVAIDTEDLISVFGEVDACMRRFTAVPKVLDIVNGIKEVMEGYIVFFKNIEEGDNPGENVQDATVIEADEDMEEELRKLNLENN